MERKATADFGLVTADTLVKTGEGYLFSISLAYKGVTAGEICTVIDGLTVAGDDKLVFVFPAANGVVQLLFPEGKYFSTGIFFNKGATAGQVWAEGQFR
jgi:hypothetical protein